MTDRVLVNKTKTALLPANSPKAGIRITRVEAAELGLVDSPDKPVQARRAGLAGLQNPEKVGPTAKAPQKRRSAPRKKKA